MKLKKTKPLRVLGVAGEGNHMYFWDVGMKNGTHFFGRREGGTSSNPHPQRVKFCYSNDVVKDCFCLGWIVIWHCEEQI